MRSIGSMLSAAVAMLFVAQTASAETVSFGQRAAQAMLASDISFMKVLEGITDDGQPCSFEWTRETNNEDYSVSLIAGDITITLTAKTHGGVPDLRASIESYGNDVRLASDINTLYDFGKGHKVQVQYSAQLGGFQHGSTTTYLQPAPIKRSVTVFSDTTDVSCKFTEKK